MSRVMLACSLLALAAALLVAGTWARYQYYSVVGPSWNVTASPQVDVRRVDRWTGTVQAWVCHDVDTGRLADVPPPPSRPPGLGDPESTEAAARTGQYYVALSMWRSAFPNVNAQDLHFTKPVCGWEAAR